MNYKKYLKYISLVLSFILPYIIGNLLSDSLNIHTYSWMLIFFLFCTLHLFIDPKKIWDFVYKKRWLICVVVIGVCVLFEYNTSSMGTLDLYVQPAATKSEYYPIFGKIRPIRSDEWGSGTLLKLSQSKLKQPFSIYNDIVMGTSAPVNLFPHYPTKSISMLSTFHQLGYLLLGDVKGLSFDSMSLWILLFFSSFEFLMLITKNKKVYSLAGAFITTFSPAVLWWGAYPYILYGEVIVLFVNLFLKTNKKWQKILYAILIGLVISNDIMTLYPAWLVPYTYVFFIIVLWQLFDNRKIKEVLKDIPYIMLAFVIAIAVIVPGYIESKEVYELMSNTVYPGARFAVGGSNGWKTLFNYIGSIFYCFKDIGNPCEASQHIGLFPLPIILGIVYCINRLYIYIKDKLTKKKSKKLKVDFLTIGLTLVAIIFSINIFFNLPFLSKITMLFYSPTTRLTIVLEYISLIMLFRIISTTEIKKFSNKRLVLSCLVGILFTLIGIRAFSSLYPQYLTVEMTFYATIIFVFLFSVFTLNYVKTNYIGIILLASVTFISGITVNPISTGMDVITDKPLAKEVRKITKKDPDSIWISAFNSHIIGNYIAANGARTINTTNYYPNMKLWEKFDGFEQYDFVYNRFAYFMIALTEGDSYFYLNQPDLITLYLNIADLHLLNADYIVSSINLEQYSSDSVELKLVYSEYGQNIYHVNYKNK